LRRSSVVAALTTTRERITPAIVSSRSTGWNLDRIFEVSLGAVLGAAALVPFVIGVGACLFAIESGQSKFYVVAAAGALVVFGWFRTS
jgi:hypothetical protein